MDTVEEDSAGLPEEKLKAEFRRRTLIPVPVPPPVLQTPTLNFGTVLVMGVASGSYAQWRLAMTLAASPSRIFARALAACTRHFLVASMVAASISAMLADPLAGLSG